MSTTANISSEIVLPPLLITFLTALGAAAVKLLATTAEPLAIAVAGATFGLAATAAEVAMDNSLSAAEKTELYSEEYDVVQTAVAAAKEAGVALAGDLLSTIEGAAVSTFGTLIGL